MAESEGWNPRSAFADSFWESGDRIEAGQEVQGWRASRNLLKKLRKP